jgi:hypothetical protein
MVTLPPLVIGPLLVTDQSALNDTTGTLPTLSPLVALDASSDVSATFEAQATRCRAASRRRVRMTDVG